MVVDKRPTDRLRERLASAAHCPRCNYTLNHLTGIRCTECGFVLAAELVHDPAPTRHGLLLWVHRFLGASAATILLILLARVAIAKLKHTLGPPLLGLLPIGICLCIWALYEITQAFLPKHRGSLMLGILLTLASILCLGAAWWWL